MFGRPSCFEPSITTSEGKIGKLINVGSEMCSNSARPCLAIPFRSACLAKSSKARVMLCMMCMLCMCAHPFECVLLEFPAGGGRASALEGLGSICLVVRDRLCNGPGNTLETYACPSKICFGICSRERPYSTTSHHYLLYSLRTVWFCHQICQKTCQATQSVHGQGCWAECPTVKPGSLVSV